MKVCVSCTSGQLFVCSEMFYHHSKTKSYYYSECLLWELLIPQHSTTFQRTDDNMLLSLVRDTFPVAKRCRGPYQYLLCFACGRRQCWISSVFPRGDSNLQGISYRGTVEVQRFIVEVENYLLYMSRCNTFVVRSGSILSLTIDIFLLTYSSLEYSLKDGEVSSNELSAVGMWMAGGWWWRAEEWRR